MRERRAFIRALKRVVAINEASAEAAQTMEMRGRLPNHESYAAGDTRPTHEANVERPAALRETGETRSADQECHPVSRTFAQQIEPTDTLHARGMGILLD